MDGLDPSIDDFDEKRKPWVAGSSPAMTVRLPNPARLCQSSGMTTAARQRLPGIDILRGAAVAAMIIYHFAWDLRFFGLIATDIVNHPFWMAFARSIAGSFLILSGVSLALMARDGLDWPAFQRRFALIAGAALLVTVATWFALPQGFIFFGILHCIAFSSLVALPFLRQPLAVVLAAAVAILVMPLIVSAPLFDAPLLQWLGLGTRVPLTNDYVPVFPWTGFALIGVALGRLIAQRPPAWLGVQPEGVLAFTAEAGRRSLPIYLVHQPVLMAVLYLAALGLSPSGSVDATTREFRASCASACGKAGGSAEVCLRYCSCAETEIRKAELWTPLLRNALTARQQQQISTITEACEAKAK